MASNKHIEYTVGSFIGACEYLGGDIFIKNKPRKASFRCRCGVSFIAEIKKIKSGHTSSCGCLLINTITKHGYARNGGKSRREYSSWQHMRARCLDVNNCQYHNYGGRGIKVCDRWVNSFNNFILDMGEAPSIKHSLDRFPNKDGDYEPSNCRWATDLEQSRNKRTNRWIEYNGEKMILQDWAIKIGIKPNTLAKRLSKWSLEKAVTLKKMEV